MSGSGSRISKGLILKRECDRSMAEKKGLLPCKGKCENCIACIETNCNGERSHVARCKC